jgi:hypothetical protein
MNPYPPPSPQPSNPFHIVVYIVAIVIAFSVAAGFLYLLFSEAFLIALVVILLIGAVGAFHWFTWGRSMTEQAKKAEEHLEAEEKAERN